MLRCTPGTPTATSPTPTSAAARSSSCWPGWTPPTPRPSSTSAAAPATSPRSSSSAGPVRSVVGLDSSAEMIEKARATTPAVDFRGGGPARLGERRGPGRRPGLQRDAAVGARPPRAAARPGRPGEARRLAGLPGTRQLRRAEPHDPRRARRPGAVRRAHGRGRGHRAQLARPGGLPDALRGLGCEVDAWETTYLHVLDGEDPVFTWVSGTGARPTLQALPADLRARFEEEFKRRLRAAYPAS